LAFADFEESTVMQSIMEGDVAVHGAVDGYGNDTSSMDLLDCVEQETRPAGGNLNPSPPRDLPRNGSNGLRVKGASPVSACTVHGEPARLAPTITSMPPHKPAVTVSRLLRNFIKEARRRGLALELVTFTGAILLSWRDPTVENDSERNSCATTVSLKPRECSILGLIGQGYSNKAIARQLSISAETVKWNIKHIFRKLEVDSRVQAVVKAQSLGLLMDSRREPSSKYSTGSLNEGLDSDG
jgi:DNA-binding CsgD family transcriptional regulator